MFSIGRWLINGFFVQFFVTICVVELFAVLVIVSAGSINPPRFFCINRRQAAFFFASLYPSYEEDLYIFPSRCAQFWEEATWHLSRIRGSKEKKAAWSLGSSIFEVRNVVVQIWSNVSFLVISHSRFVLCCYIILYQMDANIIGELNNKARQLSLSWTCFSTSSAMFLFYKMKNQNHQQQS